MKTVRTMTRDEWDALRYPVELRPLSEEEGGGWVAFIPLLGRGAFMVDAETPADAVQELEELRRARYDMVIDSGQPIPLPLSISDERELPSGRFLMRTTPRLHKELQVAAQTHGISLSRYSAECMERGHLVASATESVSQAATQGVDAVRAAATEIIHQLQQNMIDMSQLSRGITTSASAAETQFSGISEHGAQVFGTRIPSHGAIQFANHQGAKGLPPGGFPSFPAQFAPQARD